MVAGCAEDLENRRPEEGVVEVWWGCHVGESRSVSALGRFDVEDGVALLEICRWERLSSTKMPGLIGYDGNQECR